MIIQKKILQISLIAASLLYVNASNAQQATTAAGGDALSTGGSVSYSIGQIDYTTNISTSGSVAQGVQQPFEIYIVSGIENTAINLNLAAYPNPTTDFLQLEIKGDNLQDLTFQLVDLTGKIITSRKIANTTEIIDMEILSSATYFLKVIQNSQEIKTFKIIKN
jgi:Secretion system C-terminal sorting domain